VSVPYEQRGGTVGARSVRNNILQPSPGRGLGGGLLIEKRERSVPVPYEKKWERLVPVPHEIISSNPLLGGGWGVGY